MSHNATLMLTGGRREAEDNARSFYIADNGCLWQSGFIVPLLYLYCESVSLVTKLLKKEKCGCGYSSCSVCTVFVQACVYMCILTLTTPAWIVCGCNQPIIKLIGLVGTTRSKRTSENKPIDFDGNLF